MPGLGGDPGALVLGAVDTVISERAADARSLRLTAKRLCTKR